MGKLPILLPPPLASSQSISLRGGKGVSRWKGHFGEERPGRYLHFAAHGTGGGGVLGVSAQCEKGWTVTKELCGFLAAVDQDWEDEGEQEGCAAVSSRVKQHVGWGRGWGVRRRVCRGYLSAMWGSITTTHRTSTGMGGWNFGMGNIDIGKSRWERLLSTELGSENGQLLVWVVGRDMDIARVLDKKIWSWGCMEG